MGMSYLIDTHIFLWWLFDDPQLHTDSREIIRNPENRIIISSASAWEIATKYRIGKLPEAKQLVEEYSQILHKSKFIELPITTVHALRAGSLPIDHRDPFDRMIMAQAELEGLPVITYHAAFQTGLIRVISGLK
ncbi:MAG: type II toxin-antitoxin system VapC family toxin [Scytonematopsis contorta HA4267-MV1]|jgi:PIN domain nuclease of toxin-antitoxin system|nr:type II toxin-antitoxin system VapC family toxin [Scytonematopsis contorta HA4267-MV1]